MKTGVSKTQSVPGFGLDEAADLPANALTRSSPRSTSAPPYGTPSDGVDAQRLAEIGLLEPDLRLYKGTEENLLISKVIASLAKCEKVRQQLVGHRNELAESCAVIGATLDMEQYDAAIAALEVQISTLKALLCAHAPEEAVELAENVKGISTEQTSVLLASLKDKHFEHRNQLVAFVGLDVMSRKNGAWVGKQSGNAYLRKVLYQMAGRLKMHNEEFRAYYERLREKWHHYTTCIIAVARKFLRLLFAFYYKRSISYPQTTVGPVPITGLRHSIEGWIWLRAHGNATTMRHWHKNMAGIFSRQAATLRPLTTHE